MKLISLLPLNIKEADDEKEAPADDAEGGSENPFAASDDEGSDSEEGGEEEGDTEADKEDEKGDEAGSTDEAKPLEVVFDANRVRKYNDVKFNVNKGTVVNVSKYGISVKLPDEQTILVNFDDIL